MPHVRSVVLKMVLVARREILNDNNRSAARLKATITLLAFIRVFNFQSYFAIGSCTNKFSPRNVDN